MGITRGTFLKASAMAAVGTAVAATLTMEESGTAAAQTATYGEAPALAAQVKAGQLPPVGQRLPEHPYVVPHKWVQVGKYGGTWNLAYYAGDGTANNVRESMYGHSILRYLRDGLEVGPGLAEKWEPNADASSWTFYFRQGLKWSDGEPWTVDDILFWWEDQVGVPELKEYPPDEARSGKGTLMTMTKVDDYTLRLDFDAPAPLTADRIAMWVNRGIGPRWMDPKHYLSQFHIKYNPSLDPNNWTDTFKQKQEWIQNPDAPTMTGWMITSFEKGVQTTFQRNPYYWAVDKAGNQLPYMDKVVMVALQDQEVAKLRYTSGQVDYVQGTHANLGLSDVATMKEAQLKSGLEVRLWDGGSGTGSMYYFNWNYKEKLYRDLFRIPTFRKALSIAYNRPQVQKALYFGTGELTTGTFSPKAIEYNVAGGKGVYQEWRDSAVKYDPEQAQQMLDSIGVTDRNGDGWREFPDGSPLKITLDYAADTSSEHIRKSEFLAADWKAVGINAELNPLPTTGLSDLWATGRRMTRTDWEVGAGPNHLIQPQWLVPMENQRWAPMNGQWYELIGTAKLDTELDLDPYDRTPPREKPEPDSPVQALWTIYDQTKLEADPMQRIKMVWDMIKIHVDQGPFISGTAANAPSVVLVKQGLMNVPQRDDLALGGFVNPWIHPTPAVYDPESWYWDSPDAHR